MSATILPELTETELANGPAYLRLRHRGLFVTACRLGSLSLGRPVDVLYTDPDLRASKLMASHIMSPVGPNEGIGKQHGFPRWADYHRFAQDDGSEGERQVSFQAKRPDDGLGISKSFELMPTMLVSETTVFNPGSQPAATSLGEHYYFALQDEQLEGVTVNSLPLDYLLGPGAEGAILAGKPLFWQSFEGRARLDFPAGHTVQLEAETLAAEQDADGHRYSLDAQLGMLVWHRPGTESICFEPTAGFDAILGRNNGIRLARYSGAVLRTTIELL
jgi:galactose mutarotase-like enzyme